MGESRLEKFVNGHVSLRVECLNPERFINMTYKSGIVIKDIKRINYTTLEFKIRNDQYKLLRKVVRRNSAKVRIIDKHGMSFLIKKSLRRKFFTLGIFIFIFIIFSLSSIIWKIDISGNRNINNAVIYKALYNAGLKQGKIKYGINLREVESSVVKQVEEISVVNIRFYGTKANVKIIERTMPPKMTPVDKPSNLVAMKEGIISKVIAYKGQSLVEEGEYVTKNQVLISGVLTEGTDAPLKTVHSMGKVIANTWYEDIKSTSINYKYEERTGKIIKKVNYIMNGKVIGIKKHNIKFQKYDKIEEKKDIMVASYKIPIQKVVTYYYEKIEKDKKLSYDEEYNMSLGLAQKDMQLKIPINAKIINKKTNKIINKDDVTVKLLYILEENIALEQELK